MENLFHNRTQHGITAAAAAGFAQPTLFVSLYFLTKYTSAFHVVIERIITSCNMLHLSFCLMTAAVDFKKMMKKTGL